MDFSQALLNKIEIIEHKWVEAVQQDGQIQTAKGLTYEHVRNSIPIVLRAIASMLSQSEESDIKTLISKSLEHGSLRAKQGYDAEEIAREYRVLRWVLFNSLEEDLVKGSSAEVIRAFRLIDTALDEVIARCFQTYTEERLRELQELQSQLELNNQELSRLIRASKENLSQLAHELKTPLTSIIGYADLFLRQQKQNKEIHDNLPNIGHIDRVLQSGRQLLHLINDALEISRYDAGQMKLHPTIIEVCDLIYEIIHIVEPLANAKQLKIEVDCDRCPEEIFTDSLRLKQILTNLLSNAIRYTKEGTIKVKCELCSEQEWSISIHDTGIGIEVEDQQRIFEPYFRTELSSNSYVADSTGLGLAIVTRMVKILQGRIDLISTVGEGSTFTVTFPLKVQMQAGVQIKSNVYTEK